MTDKNLVKKNGSDSLCIEATLDRYPPNCTHKEKIGLDQELTIKKALSFYGAVTDQSIYSGCSDLDSWRDKKGVSCDHRIGSQLGESKSWRTGEWVYPVGKSTVEEEINSRFRNDDPPHSEEWILFIADLSGFTKREIEYVEADHILEIGYQVESPNEPDAHRRVLHELFEKDDISIPDSIAEPVSRVLCGELDSIPDLLTGLEDAPASWTESSQFLIRAIRWVNERVREEVDRFFEESSFPEALSGLFRRVLSLFGLNEDEVLWASSVVMRQISEALSDWRDRLPSRVRGIVSSSDGLLDRATGYFSSLRERIPDLIDQIFRILTSALSITGEESSSISGSGGGSGGNNKGPPPPAYTDSSGNERSQASSQREEFLKRMSRAEDPGKDYSKRVMAEMVSRMKKEGERMEGGKRWAQTSLIQEP